MPAINKKNKSARGTGAAGARTSSSSSSSSSSKSATTRATTRVSPRVSPRMSPRVTPRVSPRMSPRVTPRVSPRMSPRVSPRVSPRATAAAFSAAVAAKDTNRLHNIPKELQIAIMKIANKMKKKPSNYDIYKKIHKNRQVYKDWLEELKRPGAVDSKKRVRNPLRAGGLIYTNKPTGLYPILYHLCFQVLQGDVDYTGIPRPAKSFYRTHSKFFNKPPDSPPSSPPLP